MDNVSFHRSQTVVVSETTGIVGPWILVAEDDRDMRWLLVKVLTSDGYDVVEAGSGLELFDTLRQAKARDTEPSLVVSDIRMPGLNGLQVLQKIRDWDLTTPVILITAFPDEETLADAEQSGVTAVLSKPFEMDDLRTAVRYLVGRPDRARAITEKKAKKTRGEL